MHLESHRRSGEIEASPHVRRQYDLCPYCNTILIWEQNVSVWTEDDNGVMQPDYDNSECWNAVCEECQSYFVDPHSDGLIRVYPFHDFEDEHD